METLSHHRPSMGQRVNSVGRDQVREREKRSDRRRGAVAARKEGRMELMLGNSANSRGFMKEGKRKKKEEMKREKKNRSTIEDAAKSGGNLVVRGFSCGLGGIGASLTEPFPMEPSREKRGQLHQADKKRCGNVYMY